MSRLVIVESPTKAKKIAKYLGPGWTVKASFGHIRQLATDGEYSLGFEIQGDLIACRYVAANERSAKTIRELKAAAKAASEVLLASDPDREGETIAWHLQDALGLKNARRVIYNEITEAAVREAIAHPRPLDANLVGAGRCRDCLDKLVGYRGSPLVWSLGAKSIGRVQSPALHLVCQREREIQSFVPQDYWSVYCDYQEGLRAFYYGSSSAQEEAPDTQDDAGSEGQQAESTRVLSQTEADRLVQEARSHPHRVKLTEGKTVSKSPPAPFTTSTLQQAAGSKLRFSPEQTMSVAQKLFEAGHITYHRTDSVALSDQYCQAAHQWLQERAPQNVPAKKTQHRDKAGAQQAHEAIRPTDINRSSADIKQELSQEEFELYVLIWKRALASQCKPARLQKTRILIQSGSVTWQARGQAIEFPGYTKYWNNLSGDSILPTVARDQVLQLDQAASEQKQTQPPPRYTEPKLVQVLERKGIGRPSTFASINATLKQRNYVEIIKGKLHPTELGMQVDEYLGRALPELLEADLTAQMESALDQIAEGKQEWQQYLSAWSRDFEPAIAKAQGLLPEQLTSGGRPKRELEKSRTKCPKCNQPLSKVSSKKVKKGYFLKCESCKVGERDLVLFWSDQAKGWQLPQPKQEAAPAKVSDYPCPVCQKPLAEVAYTKDGIRKTMLKCSDPSSREDKKHKDVAFFKTKQGNWWSKKYGELNQ